MPRKKTQEEVIAKFIEVHGNKYDYSKVEYINSYTKVCIICPIHGEFWQTPKEHIKGCVCPLCADINRSKCNRKCCEEFKKQAKEIHGDKYDYSKVEYINNKTKVCIICPEHGEFWMSPQNHTIQKQGCPICGRLNRKYTKHINSNAKKIPLSKILDTIEKKCKERNISFLGFVEEKWESTKKTHLKLRCNICSHEWKSLYRNFITYKHGCQTCYNNRRGKTLTKTRDEFIQEAKEIHGGKYDYSKVEYINNYTKVCIICPEHGEFWITPNKHLAKQGCGICAKIQNGIRKRKPMEEVKKIFNKIHGNTYTYDWNTYTSMEIPMRMFCQIHGEFWQAPFIHASGCGCQKCQESHLERGVRKLLTDLCIDFKSQVNKNTFSWLNKQSLDFYIPSKNIVIECQGKQHFQPIKHFGGNEEFEKILKRDLNKKHLTENNEIRLLYVVDDDIKIEKLPSNIYNINNTLTINKLKNILNS